MLLQLFVMAYAAVFAAEVLGDKLLYTTGVLATRYRTLPMMSGIALAFMAKMVVAVAVGQAVTSLPPAAIAVMTAASFCWIASRFWSGDDEAGRDEPARVVSSGSEAAMVSFASVFFTEWGDVGQLTAATLALQLHAPTIVWIAAVAAMLTKATLAAALGVRLRLWVGRSLSRRTVRVGGLTLVIALAVLSVVEALGTPR